MENLIQEINKVDDSITRGFMEMIKLLKSSGNVKALSEFRSLRKEFENKLDTIYKENNL